MTYMTLTSTQFTLGSTNWSDQCQKCELTLDVDENDVTTFASQGWKEVTNGLKHAQLALTMLAELDDNGWNETIWNAHGSNMAFTTKASSASTSVSNPQFSGVVLVKAGKIAGGQVGQVDTQEHTWTVSGAVTRTTG